MALFKSRKSVSGLVVKVADGDTFRVGHLPPMALLRGSRADCASRWAARQNSPSRRCRCGSPIYYPCRMIMFHYHVGLLSSDKTQHHEMLKCKCDLLALQVRIAAVDCPETNEFATTDARYLRSTTPQRRRARARQPSTRSSRRKRPRRCARDRFDRSRRTPRTSSGRDCIAPTLSEWRTTRD